MARDAGVGTSSHIPGRASVHDLARLHRELASRSRAAGLKDTASRMR